MNLRIPIAACIALAAIGAAAADETAEFRQRYRLNPAKAKANATRVPSLPLR